MTSNKFMNLLGRWMRENPGIDSNVLWAWRILLRQEKNLAKKKVLCNQFAKEYNISKWLYYDVVLLLTTGENELRIIAEWETIKNEQR